MAMTFRAVALPAAELFGGRDGTDLEIDSIQHQFRERLGQGPESQRHLPRQTTFPEIGRDVQRDVQCFDLPVGA